MEAAPESVSENLMLNDDYLPSVLRYSKVVVLCFSLIASLLGQSDRVGLLIVN